MALAFAGLTISVAVGAFLFFRSSIHWLDKSIAVLPFHVRRSRHRLGLIERSLQIPAGITFNELQRDPTWDPLRSDSRFKQLTAKNIGAR